MVVKGIVSAIYADQNKISVILPEYDNATTPPLSIYGEDDVSNYNANEFVIVLMFNSNFSDGIILSKYESVKTISYLELTNKPKIEGVTLSGDKTYKELNLDTVSDDEVDNMFSLVMNA